MAALGAAPRLAREAFHRQLTSVSFSCMFDLNAHTNPHKAAVIFTSDSSDGCKDLTQKVRYLGNTEEARWETRRIRGRLSPSLPGPWNPGGDGRASKRLRRFCSRPLRLSSPRIIWIYNPFLHCWDLDGSKVTISSPPVKHQASMAPGQSMLRSYWVAGSHGNLWTQQQEGWEQGL